MLAGRFGLDDPHTPWGIFIDMDHFRKLPTGVSLAALVLSAGLVVGFTSGCSSTTTESEDPPAATATQGTSEVVSADEFANVIAEPNVVILDVRSPEEFAEGHIEGAENIDINGPDFAGEVAQLDPNVTYAVYCRSGNRSAQAVSVMVDQGFTSLYDLGGGISSWESAGYPVV